MHEVVRRTLLGAGWCALLAAVGGMVLYLVGWQQRLLILLASGATYLMLGALVALLLFLAVRGWRSAVAAALVLFAVLWTQLPLFVADGRADSDVGGVELTVVQANLLFGQADAAALVAEVRDRQADVLTVNELTPAAVTNLRSAGLERMVGHHYLVPRPGGGGTGIYSRFPLTDPTAFDGFLLGNLTATLQHPTAGPVGVYAFHPIPPTADHAVWAHEMHTVHTILAAAEGSTVVGADFNATSDHAAFRAVLDGRFDSAAEQAGAGRLLTYPADTRWGPVIGIDHILVAGGSTRHITTFTIPGTDHRAVAARIRLPDHPG